MFLDKGKTIENVQKHNIYSSNLYKKIIPTFEANLKGLCPLELWEVKYMYN
jgi:hypothetical protein